MVETSLLTKSYRELLENEPVTGETARQDRMRMRERVSLGLQDASHLNQYARNSDIKRIFHRSDNSQREHSMIIDERGDYSKSHWVHAAHVVALAWRGLRLNGMDQQDIFERVIRWGIVNGEAEYLNMDSAAIESDMSLKTLKAHKNHDDMDPLKKWKHDLGLTSDDFQELMDRLSEHPDVEEVAGKEIGPLIENHLIEDSEQSD